ncbi:MAG: Rpn family recombination-promoting nuclease/putative transposase [Clostridiales Family XIII bacterium]|jgi:hypothetical protein|nr:Rpn family recombination-promoting nuclease/putative transposase [Clostridiales Family XIII bacterium]
MRGVDEDFRCFGLTDDKNAYHHRYFLYDREHGNLFTNLLQIDILEVTKLSKGGDGTPLRDRAEFFGADNAALDDIRNALPGHRKRQDAARLRIPKNAGKNKKADTYCNFIGGKV